MMKTQRAPARGKDFWQGHIRAWRASGLSKPEYCSQHDLSLKSLYRWDWMLKKVKQAQPKSRATKSVQLIPISVVGDDDPAMSLTPPVSSGIRIHVRDQFVVELAVGFDATSLARLWQTWS